MSDFSDYLDDYMVENEIKSSDLALDVDMDRTLIHRYRKGSRVPSNQQTVVEIADALHMNLLEKKTLLEKYDLINLGENVVYNYKYVKKLLSDLQATDNEQLNYIPQVNASVDITEDAIVTLNSKDEVVSILASTFLGIEENESVTIQMKCQPSYDEIINLINVVSNNSNIRIEHLICFEKSLYKGYENCDIFGKIIPLVLNNMDYNTYYYYDSIISHINEMTLLPNIIIVNDMVVQFDYEMQSGILVKDNVYAEYMKDRYAKMLEQAEVLLYKSDKPMELLDIYSNIHDSATHAYSIYNQPCIGFCSSADMFEEYLVQIPHREEFIKGIVSRLGNWEGKNFILPDNFCKKITAYCKISGLRNFMDTGRVDELPEVLYHPLGKNTRMKILERLIYLVKNDIVNCVFIDEDIELSNNIYFYWNDAKQVFFHKLGSVEARQVRINTTVIYQSIQDFLTYMDKKDMVKKKDAVLDVLEEIWREYW